MEKEKNDFAKSQKAHSDSINAINDLQHKLSEVETDEKNHYSEYQSSIKSANKAIGKL